MNRTIIEAERILRYDPKDLCRLVGDVRAYPHFVPWLKSLRVVKETPLPEGGWEGVAEAMVGWRSITERFATSVRCDPVKGEVEVALVRGPFHALDNRWTFEPHGDNGARVRCWISYRFKNPLLQAAAAAAREKAAERIMEAFEREARRRFGGSHHPQH